MARKMEREMEREMVGTELPVLRRTASHQEASPKTKIKRYIEKPNQKKRAMRKEDCPKMLAKLKERLALDKYGRTVEEAAAAEGDENYTWMVDINTLQEFQRVHEMCDKFRNNPNTPVDDDLGTPEDDESGPWDDTTGERKGNKKGKVNYDSFALFRTPTPDAERDETKRDKKGEGKRKTRRRGDKRKKTHRRKLRRGKKTKRKPHRSKPKKKTRGKRRN